MRRSLRFIGFGADALLILLFLFGYAARYVHPRYAWVAELVAVGLPYLSVLLIGATVAVGLARRWRLLAVHLVLLGLIVIRFAPPVWLSRAAEAHPDDLTVMTYNVPRWSSEELERQKEQDMTALVGREEPDVLGLQEARIRFRDGKVWGLHGQFYLEALLNSMGYRVRSPKEEGLVNIMQPVLSHLEIDEVERTYLPEDLETAEVMRVRLQWQGRPMVVYNLHLRSFGQQKPWEEDRHSPFSWLSWGEYLRRYRTAFRDRAREAERIRQMLDEETLPTIVVGDFNSTQHSWVYREILADRSDAFKVAGSGWGATYHRELPFARIDFIMASPEFEVISAHVPEGTDLSDHRPLVARLRWKD